MFNNNLRPLRHRFQSPNTSRTNIVTNYTEAVSSQLLTGNNFKPPECEHSQFDEPSQLKRANPKVRAYKRMQKELETETDKKSGHWTEEENRLYIEFLLNNRDKFENADVRRRVQVFRQMSQLITSRVPDQCRSHHQKLQIKYGSLDDIVKAHEALLLKAQDTTLKQEFTQKGEEPSANVKVEQQPEPTVKMEYLHQETHLQPQIGLLPNSGMYYSDVIEEAPEQPVQPVGQFVFGVVPALSREFNPTLMTISTTPSFTLGVFTEELEFGYKGKMPYN